jgi:hypothetical protein
MIIGGWRGMVIRYGLQEGPLLLVKCSYRSGVSIHHVARRVPGGYRSVSRERFFLPEARCVVLGTVEGRRS